MEFPLVTIFTLIYNTNPKYVIEAIESVRNNNYPNIQHIIIDDCSPDPTPKQIVKQWITDNNYPCEFYEHELNYGICKTLNHVLDLTKGKYLIGCCDDILLKNRIIDDVTIFESLIENYAVIYSKAMILNNNGELTNKFLPEFEINENSDYFDRLIQSNFIPAPTVTYKTSLIKKIGGFNEEFIFEDYEMWLRILSKGFKLYYYNNCNTIYRVHNESMSNSNNKKKIALINRQTRKIQLKYIKYNSKTFHENLYKINNDFLLHNHSINTIDLSIKSYFYLIIHKKHKIAHTKSIIKTLLNVFKK